MNFYLPGFYDKYKLNIKIIDLYQEHPEYFIDNFHIGAIYGNFPGSLWSGGRNHLGYSSQEEIKTIINDFNNRNIPLRFTFSNCLLEKKHLNDEYSNFIIEQANNGMNGIIINSPILEEYLRNKYPNFDYISSTTKCIRDINQINDDCDNYDMVVLDYRDNCNINLLDKIRKKEKIELLLNSYCHPNCPIHEDHYIFISYTQLHNFKVGQLDCPGAKNFQDALKFSTVIKKNELLNLNKMGFNNFKLEGRGTSTKNVIENYIYYFIKPSYTQILYHLLEDYNVKY